MLYISLEMDPADCTARLVGNLGGGSAARYMFGGQLSEEEYRRFASGMSQLSRLPIVFNRRSGINIRQIEALCFREKPGLLVIDHLGLLEPPEKRLSLYEATTRNSRALKLLAMRLDIPILCLCQLNRPLPLTVPASSGLPWPISGRAEPSNRMQILCACCTIRHARATEREHRPC